MLNSLRSLRCSAAKKRAKVSVSVSVSVSGSDPDSPDSAVRLDLGGESPPLASPTGASPTSESGLSSLYSPPLSRLGGIRTRSVTHTPASTTSDLLSRYDWSLLMLVIIIL